MFAFQQAVAIGMSGYVRASFRLRSFGLERLALEPGTILAVSHRSDDDIPVLVSAIRAPYSAAVAEGLAWPTFASDDGLFLRGFLAGYPPWMPLPLRRLLWPIRIADPLERHLRCVPVREPGLMRVVEVLRAEPERPLDGRLGPEVTTALRRRAAQLGHPQPRMPADVLSGAYADVLWTMLERGSVADADELWRARLREAVRDFRRLIETVRGGDPVVIFPEGQPSADGDIGPLHAGISSLARRGRAQRVQPIAICYDDLAYGRPRAYVSVAPTLEPPPERLVPALTGAIRSATPLTGGQLAAAELLESGKAPRPHDAVERTAEEWVARATREGRPVEPALIEPRRRKRALKEALGHARRRGVDDPTVRRLARELRSAHTPPS